VFSRPGPPRPVPLNSESLSGEGGVPSYQILDGEEDYGDYVARYDAEIRYADAQAGRLLDELKRLGLYGRAVIVLTSDHGEGMGERSYYFAHGEHVRAPLLRVPLILKHGDRLEGRRRDPVSHVDVVPTLQKLIGFPAQPRWRGRDLLARAGEPRDRFALAESPQSMERELSLARGGLQLIHVPGRRRDELFDLRRDPNALVDLSDDPAHAERVERMRVRAVELRAAYPSGSGSVGDMPELSDDERHRLRSLGYVR